MTKLNIGGGFQRFDGFLNVDFVQCVDNDGKEYTDVICDIARERLPFEDNSVDEIACYEFLEHMGHERDNPDKQEALIWVMNEMWRVLKPEGILKGKVPGTDDGAFADPTHTRYFRPSTFDYFTGINKYNYWQPSRPRLANYNIKPWYKIEVDNKIRFTLRPRKTKSYDQTKETL